MTPTISTLLDRVKAGTGPDRELDRAIWEHFVPPPTERVTEVELPPGFGEDDLSQALDPTPNLTASVDACLALAEWVLGDVWWHFAKGKTRPDEPLFGVQLIRSGDASGRDVLSEAEHDVFECALILAILTALEANTDE